MLIDRPAEIGLHNLYSIADDTIYEPLTRRAQDDEYRRVLQPLLPASWELKPDGLWLYAGPPVESVERVWTQQGYKIHVSCTPCDVAAVLHAVVPRLAVLGVPFKIVGDSFLFHLQNAKQTSRGTSGKFLTVYPPDEATFRALIEEIYALVRALEVDGPRILSDKKYKAGAPVYYRYGTFLGQSMLTVDGLQAPILTGPSGKSMPDLRLPVWQKPDWESDPFGDDATEAEEPVEVVLGERYQIDNAIGFTNAGGIYVARDLQAGRSVVVKEARPHTNFWTIFDRVLDARDLLHHEHAVLARLTPLDCVPGVLDLIDDAGHLFLVMEHVEGERLDHLAASDNAIAGPYLHRPMVRQRFETLLRNVGGALIEAVQQVHDAGVVLGDLSPSNVLYDAETQRVRIVDFEAAYIQDASEEQAALATHWGTAGFSSVGRPNQSIVRPQDDWFAVGRLLLFLAVPIAPLFHLCPEAEERVWELLDFHRSPRWLRSACAALRLGQPREAAALLSEPSPVTSLCGESQESSNPASIELLCCDIIEGVARALRRSCTPERQDRLWPAHYLVHMTNPMSISFGACGPILFFRDIGKEPPARALAWMEERQVSEETMPPGLFLGLSGLAYTWARLSREEEVDSILSTMKRSPLLFADPTLEVGVAGWGLACLRIHQLTGLSEPLELSNRAARYLIREAQVAHGLASWRSPEDDRVHYGFARGAAGIALFLLTYAALLGDRYARRLGRAALEFDLEHRVETSFGWQWRRVDGEGMVLPYYFAGSAGIGAVCLRAYGLLGEERYLELARRIAEDCFLIFAYCPGLHEGLAGIGEYLLDMYRTTGEMDYLSRAMEVARGIAVFRIEQSDGIRFPGRWLTRISDDYATGSAGIGCFLDRLVRPRGRLFLDS